MKNWTNSRKGAYLGAGTGLAVFALFGLLPGSLLGGVMGTSLAGWLYGMPLEPGLMARAIVLASMLVGITASCCVIVTMTSSLGWLAGKAADTVRQGAAAKARA